MPVPKIDDVRPLLEKFELRIRKVLEDAWTEDWLAIPERLRNLFDATTRANCMFSFVKYRALVEFESDPEIRAERSGRSVKFLFKGRILVRLKKANPKSGLGSNIPTQATLEFVDPQIPLLSLPEIYHVDVLYSEDAYAKRIQSIEATARQGHRKLWGYEIQRPADSAGAPVIQIQPPPNSGLPPPAVVRPREKDVPKSHESDKPQV